MGRLKNQIQQKQRIPIFQSWHIILITFPIFLSIYIIFVHFYSLLYYYIIIQLILFIQHTIYIQPVHYYYYILSSIFHPPTSSISSHSYSIFFSFLFTSHIHTIIHYFTVISNQYYTFQLFINLPFNFILYIYTILMSSQIQKLFQQSFIIQSITQFIRKVYLILQTHKYDDLIAWDVDNKTIVIKDLNKIVQEVLPRVFKQKTLRSFIRQLNMYGFRKVKKQGIEDKLFFQNPNFIRGNLQNLVFIKRKQRGYMEKNKLQKNRHSNILERYNTYAYGVLEKLKSQFSKIESKFPAFTNQFQNIITSQNICIQPNQNIQTLSSTHSHPHSQLSSQPTFKQLQRKLINMFQSFHSMYALPMFKSNLSFPDQNQ